MERITFRPLLESDLDRLHLWLNSGAVLRNYAKEHQTHEKIREKYLPRITGAQPVNSFIALYDGEEVGYFQWYRAVDFPEWNQYVRAGDGVASIDFFIGEEGMRGKGLGSKLIEAFVQNVVFKAPSISECIAGPDPKNEASKKSLEKAGFSYYKTVQTDDGEEYLMKKIL